ncbi:hypothetical protein CEQ90_09090 [Lewinellaceae bacterium SD302]|nr:hypothetical protein CEQ90_09090 [Lewinellaceae bacterium SD302]
MQTTPWFNRRFNYPDENIIAPTLERLAGTPLRLIDKVSRVEDQLLIRRPTPDKWSIQEQVGHLLDLESLWQGRIDDILNGAEYLRSYDLSNGPTEAANHNAAELEDLLVNFTISRRQTLDVLAGLNEHQLFSAALHPRLQQPLRTQDLALFVADHDDHHLAKITELMQG